MWSKEELDEGERILVTPVSPPKNGDIRRETVRALMTRAVELAAARGGTMTDNQVTGAFAVLATREDASRAGAFAVKVIRERLTALGASNAVLEAENATLKARDWACAYCDTSFPEPDECRRHAQGCSKNPLVFKASMLEKERAALKEEADEQSSQRETYALALEKAERERDALKAELAKVHDSPDDAYNLGYMAGVASCRVDAIRKRSLEATNLEQMISENGLPAMLRYVVDGPQCVDGLTITAANRGAPGDVLVSPCIEGEDDQPLPEGPLEIVYPCSPSCTHDDAASPGHPERVREQSEAFIGLTLKPDSADAPMSPAMQAAYDSGAEAMRAACWEAVAARLETEGYDRGGALLLGLKAAIEGAAP